MKLSFSFIAALASLTSSTLANSLIENDLQALSQDSQWHHLLHYHQAGLFSPIESQIDDPNFFISPDGKTDPFAELQASIQAFKSEELSEQHFQCRFPARFNWIQTQFQTEIFPKPTCDKFTSWFNKIDANGLTLIFPAAYLNSPSSMFGHTFIRLDRASGSNSLLDYSVNFAANADPNDNELVFSYKGLTGGYPGVYSILPYYEKVKEYSFLESRDVWEYSLKLSQDEVDQFVRHIWEVRNSYLDYYFFSENCSYQILTILDAASPRFDFSKQFYLSTKPADTVRVIEQTKLIKQASFRPSTQSYMSHILSQTDKNLEDIALSLVSSPTPINTLLANLNSKQQAQALELAYHYNRYLRIRKKQNTSPQNKRAIALLSARSKLTEKEVFSIYPQPKYRDDQGHGSHRLEYTAGLDNENTFTQLGLRLAYHDKLDPLPGYMQGAKLELFNTTLRHTFHSDKTGPMKQIDSTRLQALHLIDIASFSPRNNFIAPTSWRIATGIKRPLSAPNELSPYLSAGAGLSYIFNSLQFYALLDGEFNLDNDIDKGYHLATGPHLGWLSQHETWSMSLEYAQLFDITGAKFKEQQASFGISKSLSSNWQIRANTRYAEYIDTSSDKNNYSHTSSISLMYYY